MRTFLKAILVFVVFFVFWALQRFVTGGESISEWFMVKYIGDIKIPEFISQRSANLIIDRALFFTIITFLFRTLDDKTSGLIKKILTIALSFVFYIIVFTILTLGIFDKFDALYPF